MNLIFNFKFLINEGGLAQLARASALHAEGQRFESVILHTSREGKRIFDILDIKKKKQVERA